MTKQPIKRTFAVQFRLSAAEMQALESEAAKQERSIAFLVRRVVLEWLKAKGYRLK